jgi:hypothetical protein
MVQGKFCLPAHVILLRDHCHNFVTSKRIRLRPSLFVGFVRARARCSQIHHAGDCLDSVALTAAISTLFNARVRRALCTFNKRRLPASGCEHRDYFNFSQL